MEVSTIVKLDELLRDFLGNETTIAGSETQNFTELGENYGSLMLSLIIHTENKEKLVEILQTVAKLPPPGEYLQQLINFSAIFRNEYHFYNTIIPELKLFLHKKNLDGFLDCFPQFIGGRLSLVSGKDVADNDAVLILENLKPLGYKMIDKYKGFDLETTKLVLRSLAKFHSTPLALKLLQPEVFQKNIKPFFSPYKTFEVDDATSSTLIERQGKIVEGIATCKHYAPRVLETLKTIPWPKKNAPEAMRGPFSTIIHADSWVNNFMVQFEEDKPTSCKIVDFQFIEMGSLARDLIFFLFVSVQISIVQERYEELVEFYYTCLVENLLKMGCESAPFSRQEFCNEIALVAKAEFKHCMFALEPIFPRKDSLKELDELNKEDIMTKTLKISSRHAQQAAFIIETFVKRKWI